MQKQQRWMLMSKFLYSLKQGDRFTSRDVQDALGVDSREASSIIQAGLARQRCNDAVARPVRTFYREKGTRTARAVYVVGDGPRDFSALSHQFADDVLCKYERTTKRDGYAMLAGNEETRRKRANAQEVIALHLQAFVLSLESS